MKTASRTRGFTLLELLVVIALMGIVTTLGTQLFFEMTDSWRMIRQRTDLDGVADKTFETIGKDFEQLVSPRLAGAPFVGLDRTSQDDKRFWGQPLNDDSIEFPVLTPTDGDAVRCVLVRYSVNRDPAAGEIDVLRRAARDIGASPEKSVTTEAKQNVVRFEAEYLAADGQWAPAWDKPELPEAVRVSLTLVNPDSLEQVTRKAVFPVRVK